MFIPKKKGGGVCTHLKFFFYIGSKAINSDELSDARARGEQMVSKQSEFSDVAGEDINGDNFVMKDGSKARELGVELPPALHSDLDKNTYPDGAGAKAHSLATNESIPQKTKSQIIDDISDDNFVMREASQEPQRNIMQTFTPDEWINKLSEILPGEWVENLTKLAKKHPEMFKSEADVFRVIKEIKDNPTHFFKNYDDEVALMGKNIDDKFANIGIKKENGEIIHANKNKTKDLERLQRRNNEMLTGTPLPATTQSKASMGGDLLQHSDKNIVTQKATNEVLLKNDFENIKTFDDVKNNFLADMKLKDDDITLQNTKKTWSDELYGKKDSTALKINGKKVPLSEVEQYALKNEIDPIKKEILKKEIIYEKLKDDFTKKQKELSKIKNEKDLQKANIELKDMAKNIKEFELKNMNDDGKIISDLEIC